MEFVAFEHPTVDAMPAELSENSPLTGAPRDSAALRRLMEEVRCEDVNVSSASMGYNRQHNRHNR
jgi:hypothetical protein